MKKLITAMLLLILSLTVWANQILWTKETALRQGSNVEWTRAAASSTDNCVVYAWSDTRDGDRDVWAQKIDAAGNPVWGASGKKVAGAVDRQEDIVVIDADNGGAIFAWVDYRSDGNGDIYAQKLDGSGNVLWQNNGVPLCKVTGTQISLNIVNDAAGGAYIIWQDARNPGGGDIYGTHILSSGTAAAGWEPDGKAIVNAAGDQAEHTFWEDGSGGAVVAWIDKRDLANISIYMQRISANGTMGWGTNGKLLAGGVGDKSSVKMAADGSGSFVFVYRDRGTEMNGDLKAQRVNASGDLQWGTGKPVFLGSSIQINPRITKTSDGGTVIVWEDGRNNAEFMDLYAQKLDASGAKKWADAGVLITDNLNDQINPRLVGDDAGGAWIVWEDCRVDNHPFGDVYAQHLNSSGTALLTANGAPAANSVGYQHAPLIRKTSGGKFVISWGDDRTGSTGMYVKSFNANDQIPTAESQIYYGLSGDAIDFQAFANGNNPLVVWKDTRSSSIANQIYYQVLKGDGSVSFQANGKTLTPNTGFNQNKFDAALHQSSGLFATIWEEDRGITKAFIQAAKINGDTPWGAEAKALSSVASVQQNLKISTATENSNAVFYTGWTDDNNDFMNPVVKIRGQKIAADGTLLWGAEGKSIADQPEGDILSDVVGRYYIWENQNWPDNNIFVKLVDEDGNTAAGWPENGLVVCNAVKNQEKAKGYLTPQGLLVVWEDLRDVAASKDIYGQLIGADGQIKWAVNGVKLAGVPSDQVDGQVIVDDNGIYLTWDDSRAGNNDIYVQKFNFSGAETYIANGLIMGNPVGNQKNPAINISGDKIVTAWTDYRNSQGSDIYLNLLNSNGTTSWNTELQLTSAIKNQQNPQLIKGESSEMFVLWKDSRSSGKSDIYGIYAQKIDASGVGIGDDKTAKNFELSQNYPNPFNSSTVVNYQLKEQGTIHLAIYNAKGELVNTLFNGMQNAGVHSVKFDAAKFNSGVYYYKLTTGGQSVIKKMVMVK